MTQHVSVDSMIMAPVQTCGRNRFSCNLWFPALMSTRQLSVSIAQQSSESFRKMDSCGAYQSASSAWVWLEALVLDTRSWDFLLGSQAVCKALQSEAMSSWRTRDICKMSTAASTHVKASLLARHCHGICSVGKDQFGQGGRRQMHSKGPSCMQHWDNRFSTFRGEQGTLLTQLRYGFVHDWTPLDASS